MRQAGWLGWAAGQARKAIVKCALQVSRFRCSIWNIGNRKIQTLLYIIIFCGLSGGGWGKTVRQPNRIKRSGARIAVAADETINTEWHREYKVCMCLFCVCQPASQHFCGSLILHLYAIVNINCIFVGSNENIVQVMIASCARIQLCVAWWCAHWVCAIHCVCICKRHIILFSDIFVTFSPKYIIQWACDMDKMIKFEFSTCNMPKFFNDFIYKWRIN